MKRKKRVTKATSPPNKTADDVIARLRDARRAAFRYSGERPQFAQGRDYNEFGD